MTTDHEDRQERMLSEVLSYRRPRTVVSKTFSEETRSLSESYEFKFAFPSKQLVERLSNDEETDAIFRKRSTSHASTAKMSLETFRNMNK